MIAPLVKNLGITLEDVIQFIPRMLRRLYTDSLMYGNLSKEVNLRQMRS